MLLGEVANARCCASRGAHRVRKSVVWEDVESAFEGRLKTGVIVNLEHLDIQDFLTSAETQLEREI